MDDEYKIIHSPLEGRVTRDGTTVRVLIHRGERLALLIDTSTAVGQTGPTVHEAASRVFTRPLDHVAMDFGLSEALAHLRHLVVRQVLLLGLDGLDRLRSTSATLPSHRLAEA
jgi:hypothetical protein